MPQRGDYRTTREDELMTKLLSAVVGIAIVTVIVSLPTVAAAQFAAPVSPGYIPDTAPEDGQALHIS